MGREAALSAVSQGEQTTAGQGSGGGGGCGQERPRCFPGRTVQTQPRPRQLPGHAGAFTGTTQAGGDGADERLRHRENHLREKAWQRKGSQHHCTG